MRHNCEFDRTSGAVQRPDDSLKASMLPSAPICYKMLRFAPSKSDMQNEPTAAGRAPTCAKMCHHRPECKTNPPSLSGAQAVVQSAHASTGSSAGMACRGEYPHSVPERLQSHFPMILTLFS